MAASTTPFKNPQDAANYIAAGAIQRGVDPAAALAVFSTEGLNSGPTQKGIGDSGTAYGPSQNHLTSPGRPWAGGPAYSQQIQDWAWSPAGLNYVLDQVAKVAKGRTGTDAINSIVSGYEKPANIPGEQSNAGALYSKWVAYLKFGGANKSIFPNTLTGEPGSPAAGAAAAVGGVVSGVTSVGDFLDKITDPSFIIRALEVVGGAILALAGLYLLAKQVGLAAVPIPGPAAAVAAAA